VNQDFQDMLAALLASGARFLVVGAHALAIHGVPRATGDLDVWVLADPDNAQRVWAALERFGAPVDTLGAAPGDLARPGLVLQIGLPPPGRPGRQTPRPPGGPHPEQARDRPAPGPGRRGAAGEDEP
jgi:hypothetical protein